MGTFPDDLSRAQEVTLVITPAVTGSVSFLGSAVILHTIRRNWKKTALSSIKYRLLAAICLNDLVNSAMYAVLPLVSPSSTTHMWGSIGTQRSCAFAGFMTHLGNIGGHYNGGLAVYFLLAIRYEMSDQVIAKKSEVCMHLWGLAWPLATGIIAYVLDIFSFSGVGCWIAPRPYLCHLSNGEVPCFDDGQRAYLYVWLFTGIPLFITCVIIVGSMLLIYDSVKKTYQRAHEQAMERARKSGISIEFKNNNSCSNNNTAKSVNDPYSEKITQAAIQACLYSFAYLLTHGWAYVIVILEMFVGPPPFAIVFLHFLCWPLQGFFNVFVFLRPTIGHIRRRNPDMSYLRVVYCAAFKEDNASRTSLHGGSQTPRLLLPRISSTFPDISMRLRNAGVYQEDQDLEQSEQSAGIVLSPPELKESKATYCKVEEVDNKDDVLDENKREIQSSAVSDRNSGIYQGSCRSVTICE